MTAAVTEDNGRRRAVVIFEGTGLPCCADGHPDALEATAHAWRLTKAIGRKAGREPR